MKQESYNTYVLTLIKKSFFSLRRGNTSLWVAILGVSIGICSLITVAGTMNGMQGLLIDKLIQIESYDFQGTQDVANMQNTISVLEEHAQIDVVVPFMDEFVFIQSAEESAVIHLRALYSTQANKDSVFFSALSLPDPSPGSYITPASVEDETGEIVPVIYIGWNLAAKLRVHKGGKVTITFPAQGAGFLPKQSKARIADVFYSASDYDSLWAFMSLEDYMVLQQQNFDTIQYGIRTHSDRKIDGILSEVLYDVESWKEKNSAFYIALRTEKIILLILSAVMYCIIVLHFRFTMIRRIRKKKDDIVSLRTLGATPSQVHLWFIGETIAVGILGTIFGIVSGLGIIHVYPIIRTHIAMRFGILSNISDTMGGAIGVQELIFIVLFTWGALLYSSWSVVHKNVKISPMKALRYE